MKIAILGWGSLLWDKRPEFDEHHEEWQFDGPTLELEFSRVSETRNGALTLVVDTKNGARCRVAYARSKRNSADDAICDLRFREGTTLKNIGFYFAGGSRKQARDEEILKAIQSWVADKEFDVVVWTDLPSNFQEKSKCKGSFSVEAAISHIQALSCEGKAKTAEYVFRAPKFVVTPLREVLQSEPWFSHEEG